MGQASMNLVEQAAFVSKPLTFRFIAGSTS
jgi:hypothetical protein